MFGHWTQLKKMLERYLKGKRVHLKNLGSSIGVQLSNILEF